MQESEIEKKTESLKEAKHGKIVKCCRLGLIEVCKTKM
jgi:hypothetical protein